MSAGIAAVVVSALTMLAVAPADADVVATDTVKFDTAEVKFGTLIDPYAGVVPGVLYWNYDSGTNLWRPSLVGMLENRGLASGECVRLKLKYYDGSTYLAGNDDYTPSSCGPGDDRKAIVEEFSHLSVDKVKVIAQVDSGGGWVNVGSKTRVLF